MRPRAYQLRQRDAVPIWRRFGNWLETDAVKHALPKSVLGQAIGYLRNQWSALQVYLSDGRLPIDNDQSEQAIRPLTQGRANWMFLGHPQAASGRLRLYSIVSSAHRHHLVIDDYLEDVLTKLADARQNHPADLELGSPYLLDLLPDRWALAHARSVRQERVQEKEDLSDAKRERGARRRVEARARSRGQSPLLSHPCSETLPARWLLRPHPHRPYTPPVRGPCLSRALTDVVVGSSRGGAVAMNIDSGDTPIVLLCPAWKTWGTATTVKPDTTILHSRADETVPFADSEELVRNSGLPSRRLIEVGFEHRLADPDSLEAMLKACEQMCSPGDSILDHPAISGHYLFPQPRCVEDPFMVQATGAELACYRKVIDPGKFTLVSFSRQR